MVFGRRAALLHHPDGSALHFLCRLWLCRAGHLVCPRPCLPHTAATHNCQAAQFPTPHPPPPAARGMLRLEPVTAAEHALWVLALNAAFLASGAPAASGAGGSSLLGGAHGEESSTQRCMQLAVGAMRWSAAILLG